jgi:hypothetical protein
MPEQKRLRDMARQKRDAKRRSGASGDANARPGWIERVIGEVPYRIALAGGWIDQPFVSRHNPRPPGSMVVIGIKPEYRFMDRSGIACGTRRVALELWKGRLPKRDPAELVHELYQAENSNKEHPSGSQDMIGLVYPGINRLDYDYEHMGGVFPKHIESLNDNASIAWLESILWLLPVASRPDGYNPLGQKNLEARWITRLGETGKRCFKAIQERNINALGSSLNDCIRCWAHILPHTVKNPRSTVDLLRLLRVYQEQYPGAMYSGCGGGYLLVVSATRVLGAHQVTIRREAA